MGKVTFAAVIYERFRNKDGKYPVKLRVTYRQTPTYFATNLVAEPSDLSLNSKEKNIPVRNNALKRKIQALVSEYEVAAESFNPDFFPEWTVGQVMAYLNAIGLRVARSAIWSPVVLSPAAHGGSHTLLLGKAFRAFRPTT